MKKLRDVLAATEGHLAVMLDGSLSILAAKDNAMRFAFCALGLRELLREFFASVAPDEKVKECGWWGATDGKVTRRDRITFHIFGYVYPAAFAKNYVAEIEAAVDELVKSINELSACLHVTPEQLKKDEDERQSLMTETIEQLWTVIELAKQHHEELKDRLTTILDQALTEEFCLGSSFDALDTLSSHTRPTGACDIEIEITVITKDEISFSGTGTVECDMQFGSDGDVRRGDGMEWGDSFPFKFSGTAPTSNPRKVDVPRGEIEIDNSSYYE